MNMDDLNIDFTSKDIFSFSITEQSFLKLAESYPDKSKQLFWEKISDSLYYKSKNSNSNSSIIDIW